MEKTDKQKLFNIFFATAVGIAIGFILIKEYFTPISAWLSLAGGAFGGLCAYILNDWRSALAATSKAWKTALAQRPIVAVGLRKAWHFIFKKELTTWQRWVLCTIISANVLLYICFPFLFTKSPAVEDLLYIYCFSVIIYSIVFTLIDIEIGYGQKKLQRYAFYSFPLFLLPFGIYKLSRVIVIQIITGLPYILRFGALYFCLFFKFIHTSDRLICGVDAFVFAMLAYGVGSLNNSWLAGSVAIHLAVFSIAGGIFGVLNKLFIKQTVDSLAVWLENKIHA